MGNSGVMGSSSQPDPTLVGGELPCFSAGKLSIAGNKMDAAIDSKAQMIMSPINPVETQPITQHSVSYENAAIPVTDPESSTIQTAGEPQAGADTPSIPTG